MRDWTNRDAQFSILAMLPRPSVCCKRVGKIGFPGVVLRSVADVWQAVHSPGGMAGLLLGEAIAGAVVEDEVEYLLEQSFDLRRYRQIGGVAIPVEQGLG